MYIRTKKCLKKATFKNFNNSKEERKRKLKIYFSELFTCLWHFLMVYLPVHLNGCNILQAVLVLDKHLMIQRVNFSIFTSLYFTLFSNRHFVEHKPMNLHLRVKETGFLDAERAKRKLILYPIL